MRPPTSTRTSSAVAQAFAESRTDACSRALGRRPTPLHADHARADIDAFKKAMPPRPPSSTHRRPS